MGTGFLEGDEHVLELDSGDGRKTLWIYWKPMNYTPNKACFMVCKLFLNKKFSLYILAKKI